MTSSGGKRDRQTESEWVSERQIKLVVVLDNIGILTLINNISNKKFDVFDMNDNNNKYWKM